MMRIQKAKHLLVSLGLASAIFLAGEAARAQAAFLEPYAGFGQLQVSNYDQANNDYDDKDIAAGFMLGMKGGYAFNQRFFAGLDYQTGGPYVLGRQTNKGEWTVRLLGGGLGLDYDIARFWAGYYFDLAIDDSKNQVKYKGTAIKVGFGLKIAKNVHANFDFVVNQIKSSDQSVSALQPGQTIHLPQANLVFVSISLPIDLK